MPVRMPARNTPFEILVVEDSQTQAEQLRYTLEKEGFGVFLAANGKEALDLLQVRIPDIIVSDIVMPEMDGFTFCKRVRADGRLKNIPVILVTSLSEPTDVIRGLEAGANNFITKPYDERYIVTRIEYLLTNRELRQNGMGDEGVQVFFSGKTYTIAAERLQILDLLLSTYENSFHQNCHLLTVQQELREANERLEEEKARTESILAAIGDGISIQDRELTVVYQNQVHISFFGNHLGEKCHRAYRHIDRPCNPCPVLTSFRDGDIHTHEMSVPSTGGIAFFEVTTSPLRDATGEIIAGIEVVRNIDERKKFEREREGLIRDLSEALASVKTLSGLIPICASCKKIRQDSGYWQQIEAYIGEHSQARFSHGICPECARTLYPEVFAARDKK